MVVVEKQNKTTTKIQTSFIINSFVVRKASVFVSLARTPMGNNPVSFSKDYSNFEDPFWNSFYLQPELLADDNFVIEQYYRLINKIETLPEDEITNKSLRFKFLILLIVFLSSTILFYDYIPFKISLK